MARKRHMCGNQQCFHGAFGSRAKAEAKAVKVKGARVKGVLLRHGDYRYLVLTKKGK